MTERDSQAKVRITRGKFNGINTLADERGVIAAAAMDQRGSLEKAIAKDKGSPTTPAEMSEFKIQVTEVLTKYASAILLDPEYGLEAIKHRAQHAGVLLAYEKTGYDTTTKGRLPDLLDHWSVRRIAEAGASAVKILMYYDPDDVADINTTKHAFIERIGAECRAYDIPFFLEIVAYSDEVGPESSFEFAKVKPLKVQKYMQEFSKPQYGVDVLKVEIPVNMRYVEGSQANTDGQVAYTKDEARQYFVETAKASRLPFIYLSAGVSNPVFLESLQLAAEANTPFVGVLCGRATWKDGIPIYAKGGAKELRKWLEDQGVHNIQALNDVLRQGAKPWWDFYGGKDRIEVVDPA
ncbi:tagatose 1,6-diphosphate aldolase [Ktedonosporobacter rubrisoli]|uniref:tagatose-bisphosphate aldolase n=1 Tax=Ktedonosporobacter rubrisoli TaxID=2509675 RepID=A0A4P6JV02_KTERU|nr:tagatose 1,6-diphosphate aldolase [Ktedonosporobacter rubrisoli]QBD78776.1 tagatose 1,6-diphosphate aldolase [Ktedonosporobacter rubrisoli]